MMKDLKSFLLFDTLIVPKIIALAFWVSALVVLVVFAFGEWDNKGVAFSISLGVILLSRVVCELLIVIFKINESLQETNKE